MTAVLLLVAACGVIALVGWIVSKVKGSHAFFIQSWQFDDGETILWRDDAADVAVIPKLGEAVSMTPARLHGWPVVVTNSRVIIGNKTLTGKAMVQYALYPGVAPDGQSKHLDGGLLSIARARSPPRRSTTRWCRCARSWRVPCAKGLSRPIPRRASIATSRWSYRMRSRRSVRSAPRRRAPTSMLRPTGIAQWQRCSWEPECALANSSLSSGATSTGKPAPFASSAPTREASSERRRATAAGRSKSTP
jgi:hypothetical protein